MPDLSSIYAALDRVVDPCSIATGVPIGLAEMGMVKSITDDHGAIVITLRLTSPICWQAANILAMVEDKVGAVSGVTSVECRLDPRSDWMPDMMSPRARARLRERRPLPARAQAI